MMLRLFMLVCFFSAFSFSVNAQESDVMSSPLYKALEKRLNKIDRELKKRNGDDIEAAPFIDFGSRLIKLGDTHANMPSLRAKLQSYLPKENLEQVVDDYVYDSSLVEAVKTFQQEVGLKDDGVIGPATLTLLNRTIEDERKQILANMYRLRGPEWANRPPLRIDVDIARYWLTVYENDKVQFEMPVVVGSTKRKTNRFSTVMTGVRLNPGWTMPQTIKSEDYIPKLRTNPEWVGEQGVMIYTSWDKDAEPIDPTTIDWNYLSDNEIKAMRFYKQAGDHNPLGRYRFLMDNRYDIYLHDTNQKYLFNRSARAQSSGCVRVSDPRRIADFLLQDNPDWTDEKIDAVINSGKTYNIRANRSIPVYFDYKTAWLNENGDLVLGYDIYGLDSDILREMEKQGTQNDSSDEV